VTVLRARDPATTPATTVNSTCGTRPGPAHTVNNLINEYMSAASASKEPQVSTLKPGFRTPQGPQAHLGQ
jgi:hypothetical protein